MAVSAHEQFDESFIALRSLWSCLKACYHALSHILNAAVVVFNAEKRSCCHVREPLQGFSACAKKVCQVARKEELASNLNGSVPGCQW